MGYVDEIRTVLEQLPAITADRWPDSIRIDHPNLRLQRVGYFRPVHLSWGQGYTVLYVGQRRQRKQLFEHGPRHRQQADEPLRSTPFMSNPTALRVLDLNKLSQRDLANIHAQLSRLASQND